MVAPREWKSQAAEQIQLMGANGSSEVLFGAGKRLMPADEMLPRQMRQERCAGRPDCRRPHGPALSGSGPGCIASHVHPLLSVRYIQADPLSGGSACMSCHECYTARQYREVSRAYTPGRLEVHRRRQAAPNGPRQQRQGTVRDQRTGAATGRDAVVPVARGKQAPRGEAKAPAQVRPSETACVVQPLILYPLSAYRRSPGSER